MNRSISPGLQSSLISPRQWAVGYETKSVSDAQGEFTEMGRGGQRNTTFSHGSGQFIILFLAQVSHVIFYLSVSGIGTADY